MTIQFSPGSNIPPNQRGELQLWIEKTVDKDTDVHLAAVSEVTSNYVMMRANWHKSTHDKQEHLTGDVILDHKTLGAAHIYKTGQVTMFSVGED